MTKEKVDKILDASFCMLSLLLAAIAIHFDCKGTAVYFGGLFLGWLIIISTKKIITELKNYKK